MKGRNKAVKKVFTLVFVLLTFIFALPSHIVAEGAIGAVIDIGSHLTAEENKRVTAKAQSAALKTGINVII